MVNFWTDLWLSKIGLLINFAALDHSLDVSLQVKNVFHLNGSWHWDLIESLLTPYALPIIRRSIDPSATIRFDVFYWSRSPNLTFTVKSAYKALSNLHWDTKLPCSSVIWKLPLPERLRGFSCYSSVTKLLQITLVDWLLDNLTSTTFCDEIQGPRNVLFASLVWQLWKARNLAVFQQHLATPASILHHSIAWNKFYVDSTYSGAN
ncbi:hypothetical protein F3Y22_tig00004355pilonHSYRG00053 [Hibiscus syriacus]|uniref:Reverse transcriptase zinc-binding domain-containing protein n=1 Tax=Hibiscus syriacus TaxID=106335 RepID=A0A6A3CH30_HIBSY|nr:hypothetical protein F3Y22_tig00004355pilonHSYRG00053 [Hibiscus syriacus]